MNDDDKQTCKQKAWTNKAINQWANKKQKQKQNRNIGMTFLHVHKQTEMI